MVDSAQAPATSSARLAPMQFSLLGVDKHTLARRGRLTFPRHAESPGGGVVESPAFMPVGTQATVKGLALAMLRATGAK